MATIIKKKILVFVVTVCLKFSFFILDIICNSFKLFFINIGLNPLGCSIILDQEGGVNNHLWSWTYVVLYSYHLTIFIYGLSTGCQELYYYIRPCLCMSCVKLAVGVRVSDGLCTRGSVYDLT